MNNLAFQIYGTKKATPFQSVWKTDVVSALGNELTTNLTATAPLTNWALAPGGTTLLTGGYTHTPGSTALLLFNLVPITVQRYQMQYTITGTGSVVINFGGVSTAPLTAGTNVIIALTTISSAALSIAPDDDFTGNIRLSIKQSASASNQIQLPISIAAGKSIWIDWGDNSYTNINSGNIIQNRLHTYITPGEYAVRILGDDFGFGFGNPPNSNLNDRLKIKSISSWGKLRMGANSFNSCNNVTMSGITDIPNLTGVTDLSNTFNACSLLTTVGRINEWNTSSVTSMAGMFAYSRLFNSNIGNWNTSAVTNMSNMFGSFNLPSNFNQDISGWNVSNVTQMNQMFDYATSFNQNLSNWERSGSSLSKVTNMEYMFRGASNFNNGFASGNGVGNQLPWTINTDAASVSMTSMFGGASAFNSNLGKGTIPWDVSNVGTFADMFNGASKFNNGDETDVTKSKINNWDIGGSVTSVAMTGMFRSAIAFNRDISSWSVSKVNSMRNMFNSANAFNQPLSNWEREGSTIGNVIDMVAMFQNANAFNQNIGNWDVRKVTNFSQMFQSSGFNNGGSSDIDNWDINTTSTPSANVNMSSMFSSTGSFNQPLNSWNTSEVINMNSMFTYSLFNNGLSPGVADTLVWNTGKVTDMASMFSVNGRFNCNIGSWNVRNVTTFNNMFREAGAFNNGGNASINTWILKATGDIDMAQMFYRASTFNQPIGSWDTSRVTSMQEMFRAVGTASIFNQDISSWNVSRVGNMAGMFFNAVAFNKSLSDWERAGSTLSNVTTMNQMFASASAFNNGELPGVASTLTWNTIGVGDMGQMFDTATAFNCDIGGFNVSNCANFGFMFRGANTGTASRFNNGGSSSIGSWTLKSTGSINMWQMFGRATAFNQPIGAWNTSRVTSMQLMFSGATAFNQNIGSWNVSNVTNFSGFMDTKTPVTGASPFSSTNLDAIYNGWIVNGVKPNTTSPLSTNISFGSAKYSQAGKPGRDTLLANPNNWRISDGGNETVLALDAGNPLSYPGTGTTWTDLSGYGNNGTLINGPTFDPANEGSIVFDGLNDYVNCGNASNLQITVGTISVWVKTTTPGSGYRGIITKQSSWGLFVKDNILITYDWGNLIDRTTGINISDGTWKNVVMTFTQTIGTPSNNAIVYLNGNAVLTTTIKYFNNNINVELGGGGYGLSQLLNGNISQALIGNRVLSATEVLANFNATKGRYGL